MSDIHAVDAPSGLYLTVACPGSRSLRAGLPPEPDTPESIEGDVAHWVALQAALGNSVPAGTERKGIKVDDDMLDGARLWLETIGEGGAHEVPIMIPDVHPDCWGTADFWRWDEDDHILDVMDYKYGHLYVEEFENSQLMAYASGLLRTFDAPNHTRVRLTVVQPRCYSAKPVRTWTTTAENIRKLVAEIAEKVRIATDTSVPVMCYTGPHCLYCPARHICGTLQSASNTVMTFAQYASSNDLDPGPLGVELHLIDKAMELLKGRRSGLAIQAEIYIKEGKRIPNWEMKPGRSNLAWNDPQKAIIEGDAMGVNLRKEVVPITPTQALDRKLLDEATINELASRPPAPQKLSYVSLFSIRKALSGECS